MQADLGRTLARIRDHGGKDFYEGETAQLLAADMQAHGGLIALPATVRPGEMVLLANIYTHEEKQCRIVRVGPEHDGKRDVGFEFLHPEGWFWWIDFDT